MEPANHLYELRRYRVADGRMQDEIDRAMSCILPVEKGGLGLFAQYGIPKPLGFWRVVSGPALPCVIFIYRWESVAKRADAFERFYVDPAWQDVRARTNGGSEIVSRLDDLLYTGPEFPRLDPALLYTFDVADSADALISLAPLCGSDPRPLHLANHPSLDEALTGDVTSSERTICELIMAGDER